MIKYKRMVLLLLGSILVGCSGSMPQKTSTVSHLTILHTNDHHGHFWKNANGEGGLAAQKTLIDRIRSEVTENGGQLLVLSGGDINTGVPESDLQDAEPDFRGMAKIGYHAMAVGNHEFDKPREVLDQQRDWAGFPFLTGNIFLKSTGQPLYDAYKVFALGDLQIAVFGLISEDTPLLTNPVNSADLEFKNAMTVARQLVPELRRQADIVVALSHLGYDAKGYGQVETNNDLTLARSVSGIDVIVGGHTHTRLTQPTVENGVIIVQAEDSGKYVGRLDLVIENQQIIRHNYRLIPVNLTKKAEKDGKTVRVPIEELIPEDPTMLALLSPFQEKGAKELEQVIGSVDGDFNGDRAIVRTQETNLGNLLTRAQRLKVKADLGVINSGGIRASIVAGPVTYKDVLKVQPFSGTITRVTLSGAELKQYLNVVANMKPGSGGFPQFDNVRIYLRDQTVHTVFVDGREVVDDGTYALALNDFIAGGGDGYPKVSDHPTFVDTGYNDADVLREFIHRQSPLRTDDFTPTDDVVRQ
jgi:5'-nucleotidase / UDP-sugar diphosphatase